MVDYVYSKVAVYAELGGQVRLAQNSRSFVTDTVTGVPVNVTQGALTAPYLDTDSSGIADFTATTPGPIRLTTGATFVDVYSDELPGLALAAIPIVAASAADAAASAAAAALSASLVGAPADTAVAAIVGNPASATRTGLDSTFDRLGAKVYHLDCYNRFFLNAGAYVLTQPGGDLSTTLTAQATAGGSTMAVTAGTMAPNGTSLITNPGTATQQIYQVIAGGGTTTLTVTPNIVTTLANGATIATLWTNVSHLTTAGWAAFGYWAINAKKPDGTLILSDPGTRPVVFLGNSWFTGMVATAPGQVTALYPSATVTMANVSGNNSTDLISRFATDVPTNAAYVYFNEPGVNDDYQQTLGIAGERANLETLVRLIRNLGAVPIFTGMPPLVEKTPAPCPAEAAALLAVVGDGWSFPGPNTSQVPALFPAVTLPVALGVATSLGAGYRALAVNVAGTGNTAFGESALYSHTGNDCSAFGDLSLRVNTGARNTAVGTGSATAQTTATDNTCIGYQAGYTNVSGTLNTAIGASALWTSTGSTNTAVGYEAMKLGSTAQASVAVGCQALRNVTTGGNSVAVGPSAGYAPNNLSANATTTGAAQTLIGHQTGQASPTQVNYIAAIGYRATVTAAGGVAIGTDSGGVGAVSVAANEIALGTANHKTKILGRLNTAVGTTTQAGVNVPHGAAPTTPTDGDVWSTTAGLFIRVNGVTKTVTLT